MHEVSDNYERERKCFVSLQSKYDRVSTKSSTLVQNYEEEKSKNVHIRKELEDVQDALLIVKQEVIIYVHVLIYVHILYFAYIDTYIMLCTYMCILHLVYICMDTCVQKMFVVFV